MAWLDWLLPPRPKAVRAALDENAAAARRLLDALRAGGGMSVEQSMDDLRDAFGQPAPAKPRRRRNGNGHD
jgi:hypothetical protein